MDEFENRVFLLKIAYEKHFSGIEPVEPARDRDELRRYLRDLLAAPVTNSRQRFRLQQLRARWSTLELYWTRNLYQIERGQHPKQKYRADARERQRAEAELSRVGPGQTLLPEAEASVAGLLADDETDAVLEGVRDVIGKCVAVMPDHTEYIAQH